MNDISPPGASEGAPLPETADVPDVSGAPDAPARPGRARRKLLTALPVLMVLGTVGVAAGYTHATVDEADRSVETTVWRLSAREPAKDPARDTSRGRSDTALSKLMLPVPTGYRLGPDDGEYGNDGEMDGERAVAVMKEGNRGLAGKERRDYDKRIDKLRVQGLAVRSYTTQEDELEVRTQIMRMKDKKTVKSFYTFHTELFDALAIFRKGPEVEGHTRNATCYLQPEDSDSEIEDMVCAAYDGELIISLSATGIRPMYKGAVAELLKDQLDHIKSPGEYV